MVGISAHSKWAAGWCPVACLDSASLAVVWSGSGDSVNVSTNVNRRSTCRSYGEKKADGRAYRRKLVLQEVKWLSHFFLQERPARLNLHSHFLFCGESPLLMTVWCVFITHLWSLCWRGSKCFLRAALCSGFWMKSQRQSISSLQHAGAKPA